MDLHTLHELSTTSRVSTRKQASSRAPAQHAPHSGSRGRHTWGSAAASRELYSSRVPPVALASGSIICRPAGKHGQENRVLVHDDRAWTGCWGSLSGMTPEHSETAKQAEWRAWDARTITLSLRTKE